MPWRKPRKRIASSLAAFGVCMTGLALSSPSDAAGAPGKAAPPERVCFSLQDTFRHDGFYVRLSVGVQYLSISGTRMGAHTSLRDVGNELSVAIGGTPLRGLVVGGMATASVVRGHQDNEPENATGQSYLSAGVLAPFVDWYPQVRGPWHVGAAAGLGIVSGVDGASNVFTAVAPGGSIFGGYDCWIGPQYSLGFGMVASGSLPADTREHGPDLGYRLGAFAVGFQSSLLWH